MRRTGSIYMRMAGLREFLFLLFSTWKRGPFFFCLLIRGSGRRTLTLAATEANGQKRVQSSSSSQNRLSFRAGRAKCRPRETKQTRVWLALLREHEEKTARHAMARCPWRGPLTGSTTFGSYDGRGDDKPPSTYPLPARVFSSSVWSLILLQLAKAACGTIWLFRAASLRADRLPEELDGFG